MIKGINIASGFDLNAQLPIDSRFVADDLTALNVLDNIKRYEGLMVYVKSESKYFQLIGGTDNSNWKELSAAGVHIGSEPPEDTNKLWIDTIDEDINEIFKSQLSLDIRNTVTEIKEKMESLEYALDYELDPGYFKGVLPGTFGSTPEVDPDNPTLDDGAGGTVGHILVKRGLKEDIENLQEGELGFCLDTEELYIGNKGMLKLIAKVGGVGGDSSGGNVTAEYVELISSSGQKYKLTVNDTGEPIILNSAADEVSLPALTEAGRFKGLIINKVYGGGAKDSNNTPVSHGFVELYNTTDFTINLKGLSLQYGEYLRPWEVLPLRGEVKPYSSFLVRCAQHSDPYRKLTRVKIMDFDMGWNVAVSDGGYKLYLKVGTEPSMFENPANTDGNWTKESGYINLFAVGGEDVIRIVDGYEKTYLHLANKNRMTKRKYSEDLIFAFSNTGDNGYDIDFIDMRTADLEVFAPRSSKYGQWDYSYDQVPLDTLAPNVINIGFGQDGNTTRTFTWQSQPTDKGYIKYRKKSETDWITVPSAKKFIAHPDHVDVTVHSVIVRNLVPGTYIYKAGFEGRWSDEYEIEVKDTSDTSKPIKMLWTTDQQSWNDYEYSAWAKANDYLENNENYDFIINTGDRSQNANRSFEWREYFSAAKNNLSRHVEMSTVGNNDLIDKLYSDAYTYYATVENAAFPSVFSWNYGCVHYISLDSNILKDPLDSSKWIRGTAEQIAFIQADMAKPENKKRWVIAFCHESPYTIVRVAKMEPFIAALYDAGVDLVLCGHHHSYTRSHRMGKMGVGKVDVLDPLNGVYYLMMQATGYKLSGKTIPTANAPWRALYEKPGDPCYGTFEITWDKISYKAYRLTNITPLIDNVNKDVVPIEFDSLEILPKNNRGL